MNIILDGLTFANQYQNCSQGQKKTRNLDPLTTSPAIAKIKNFSKQLIATNGQVITFSLDDKTISASLLNEGKYIRIKAENLPKELRKLRHRSDVNKFLAGVSVRLAKLSSGDFNVYMSGRLLGGDPIKEAVSRLKTHLVSLVNPLVAMDILQKLVEFNQNVVDPENLIDDHFFSGLLIPEATKRYLIDFFDLIQEIFRNCTNVEKTVNELKTELGNLTKKPGISTLSEALKIFLSLDKIKQLSDKEIGPIVQIIKAHGDFDQLEIMVEKVFEENHFDREEIDECIAKAAPDYEDLTTVLKQIIKQNEIKKDGIAVCWDNSEASFLDKTLYLTDQGTSKTFQGVIRKAERKDAGWHFELKNGSFVGIFHEGDYYRVELKEMIQYRFQYAFHYSLNPSDVFKFEETQDQSSGLPFKVGTYQLLKKEYQKETSFSPESNLFYISGESHHYRLKFLYHSNALASISVEEWHKETWREVSVVDNSWWYKSFVFKATPKEFETIPQGKVNSLIRLKDEKDESTLKLAYQREYENKKINLRKELLLAENKEFLDQMLDNLFENRLSKVDIEIAKSHNPTLISHLEGIVQDFEKKLKVRIQIENLFRQLIEEANYERLTARVEALPVAKTMELLKGATEHLSKLNNQDLIFLMGNTGSGKSTAANYLIGGASLKSVENHVGDIIIEAIKKEVHDEDGQLLYYPIIGQSLGESETLYTIGYKIRKVLNLGLNLPLIADCPGFEDTREGEHKLCTNLSIDQAFKHARAVKAIVWTIPIQAFTNDRGNQIIDLIDSFKDRFPQTFNLKSPQLSSNVYILITKAEQVLKGTKEAIANGKRFKELFKEADNKIREFLEKESLGEVNDLKSVSKRRAIWQFLSYMHDNHQVDLIDIGDNIARKELLKKYCSEKAAIKKNHFISCMQSHDLRSKFGKDVELSTFTWMQIFEKYLKTLPDTITTSLKEIKNKEEQVLVQRNEQKNRLDLAAGLDHYAKTLSKLILDIEKAKNDSTEMSHLDVELRQKIKCAIDDRLRDLNRRLLQLKTQRAQAFIEVNSLQEQLGTLELSAALLDEQIDSDERRKRDLEWGTQSVVLKEVSYQRDQVLNLRNYKAGAREKIFEEVRDARDDDFENKFERNTSEHRGTLLHTIRIEKQFRIVPTDSAKRRDFETLGHSGEHEARLEGVAYSLDLGRKIEAQGQSIIYGLKTEWDGNVLPWFRITHIIPKSEYNAAAISNLENSLVELRSQKIDNLARRTIKEREFASAQQSLEQLKTQIIETEQRIKQLSEDLIQTELGKLDEEKKAELQRTQAEALRLRNLMEIDGKISGYEIEIEDEKQKLSSTQKIKRNFAIIVKNQLGVVELLRQLSTVVIHQSHLNHDFIEDEEEEKSITSISLAGSSNNSPNSSAFASLSNLSNTFTNEASAINTCQKFIEIYDQKIDELKQKCKEDLNC